MIYDDLNAISNPPHSQEYNPGGDLLNPLTLLKCYYIFYLPENV